MCRQSLHRSTPLTSGCAERASSARWSMRSTPQCPNAPSRPGVPSQSRSGDNDDWTSAENSGFSPSRMYHLFVAPDRQLSAGLTLSGGPRRSNKPARRRVIPWRGLKVVVVVLSVWVEQVVRKDMEGVRRRPAVCRSGREVTEMPPLLAAIHATARALEGCLDPVPQRSNRRGKARREGVPYPLRI